MNLSEMRCQVSRVPKVAKPAKVVQMPDELRECFWRDVFELVFLLGLMAWALILCGTLYS